MTEEIENNISNLPESKHLYEDVCHIIDDTRTRVAVYVNSEVCMTNWRIGTRIKEDVLYNKRAEYGKQVIKNLSLQLTERYGKGWSEKTLPPATPTERFVARKTAGESHRPARVWMCESKIGCRKSIFGSILS